MYCSDDVVGKSECYQVFNNSLLHDHDIESHKPHRNACIEEFITDGCVLSEGAHPIWLDWMEHRRQGKARQYDLQKVQEGVYVKEC